MSSMKTINDLPPELLMLVVELIPDRTIKDLRSPCLSVRRLSEAATPYLYSDVALITKAIPTKTHRIFLRTITQNTSVAHHVTRLETTLHSGLSSFAPSPSEQIRFLQAATGLSRDTYLYPRLVSGLQRGSCSADATVMLYALAPTLQRLKFHCYDMIAASQDYAAHLENDGQVYSVSMLFRPSMRHSGYLSCAGAFEKLTSVSIKNCGHERVGSRLPYESLLFLLELPRLAQLNISGFGDPSHGFVVADYLPTASTVKRLKIHDCNFNTTSITTLLDRCHAIERFELRHHHDFDLDRTLLHRSLQVHAKSLTVLLLRNEFENTYRENPLPETPLQEFEALRRLETNLDLFCRWHDANYVSGVNDISGFFCRVLPPNLDQLDAYWMDSLENLSVYLRALATMLQTRLPKKLFLTFHCIDTDNELVQRLQTPISPAQGLSIGMDKDGSLGIEVQLKIAQPFDLSMHGAVLADLIDEVGLEAAFETPLEHWRYSLGFAAELA